MAYLSPFSVINKQFTSCTSECKFLGTYVFNHLPRSSHERQTHQSNFLGLRGLNRGSYCTPKFALPYSSRFVNNHLQMVQDSHHQVAQSKALIAPQATVGVKWSFGSQKSKILVNILFGSHNHHLVKS